MANKTIRTRSNRERFLRIISEGGSVRLACLAIGISRNAAYVWRTDDESFATDWQAAFENGTDLYEDALLALSAQGNLAAIQFALRSRRPEMYARQAEAAEFPPGGHNAIERIAEDATPQIYIPHTEQLEAPTIDGEVEDEAA
jgi:hypothetical protein